MRMNLAYGKDAAFWLAQAREQDIAEVLREYGRGAVRQAHR